MPIKNPLLQRQVFQGQVLVEFVLVMPILLLILMGAYLISSALYTGTNAASAMKEPLLQKAALADNPNATQADVIAMIQAYQSGSFRITGTPLDSVTVANMDHVTAVLVGKKTVNLPLFPPIVFSVTQGINSNLLRGNTGQAYKAGVVPSGLNTTPYSGSLVGPGSVNPTDYGIPLDGMLENLPLLDTACSASQTISIQTVNQLIPLPQYTIGRFSSPVAPFPAVASFSPIYTAPTRVEPAYLLVMNNTTCDAQPSLSRWVDECIAEYLYSGGQPGPQATVYIQACSYKKWAACRLQYASQYANAVMNTMVASGACDTPGETTVEDVTFDAHPLPY